MTLLQTNKKKMEKKYSPSEYFVDGPDFREEWKSMVMKKKKSLNHQTLFEKLYKRL